MHTKEILAVIIVVVILIFALVYFLEYTKITIVVPAINSVDNLVHTFVFKKTLFNRNPTPGLLNEVSPTNPKQTYSMIVLYESGKDITYGAMVPYATTDLGLAVISTSSPCNKASLCGGLNIVGYSPPTIPVTQPGVVWITTDQMKKIGLFPIQKVINTAQQLLA
jgi:hypothetical protein